jgi:hypothetical protein
MIPTSEQAHTLTVPADRRLLDVAADALAMGRYLPVDAQLATTTAGGSASALVPGPRALGYGSPDAWLVEAPAGTVSEATVTWRTAALPPSGRTVVGRFRRGLAVWQAAARLSAVRPAGLVALDVCNLAAGAWLLGTDDGTERALVARLEGDADAVARGHRAVWQAVELERGEPYVFEQVRGPWVWGPVLAAPAPGAVLLRWEAPPDLLPLLVDALDEAAGIVGPVSSRSHVALGVLHGTLPPGPRQVEARRWLTGVTQGTGARMEEIMADLTPQPQGG